MKKEDEVTFTYCHISDARLINSSENGIPSVADFIAKLDDKINKIEKGEKNE